MHNLEQVSRYIRRRSLELVYSKKASHIGGAFSIVEILSFLYGKYLNVSPENFKSNKRDRLFYSKGHACTSLYATLEYFKFVSKKELDSFTDNGSYFTSHVSHNVNGVELSTGSLGHALSVASGVALSGKINHLDYKVVCIVSDGELNEGSNWEAIMFLAHQKLKNLTLIIDYNKIQSFGRVEDVLDLSSLKDKFTAFNFHVEEIDGHDLKAIDKAFYSDSGNKPKVIIAHTIKGKGVSFMEDKLEWHYKSPTADQYKLALDEIGE